MEVDIKTVVANLKAIVGEFPVKAKDFYTVIAPITMLLTKLESGEYKIVSTTTEEKTL